jgi:hypothetical protein
MSNAADRKQLGDALNDGEQKGLNERHLASMPENRNSAAAGGQTRLYTAPIAVPQGINRGGTGAKIVRAWI